MRGGWAKFVSFGQQVAVTVRDRA